jgi:hypothetical protein
MTDADLEIIDQSPRSPFDFSLPDYNRQFVAGYSKNTSTNGLVVFMPDLTTLSRRNPCPPRRTRVNSPCGIGLAKTKVYVR